MPRKVVFITDADSPSGKAFIARFRSPYTDFVLNSASNGSELTDLLDDCRIYGAKAIVVHIDLCSRQDLSSMLDMVEEQMGAVNVLIHNTCSIQPAKVETCEEEKFLEILQTNAKSAFFCTQIVGKRMVHRKNGSVIFVSSIHSEKPTGSSFAFSASQGAVKMLAHEAALFLGRHGIRVNVIEMGPIEGSDASFPSDVSGIYDSYRYKVPSTLLGTYKDLADLAFFLTKNEARHLNGADIRLDGGFLLHYMDHKMNKPDVLEESL